MEVEIVSRERVKPSSPTPTHLKTYKLCLLDQFQDHFFFPNFYFYPSDLPGEESDHIVSKRTQLLKQSLSETLVHFYPLAGKLTRKFTIDCNDEGVYFVEAKVKSTRLVQFLEQPDLNLIHKFFPVTGSEKLQQDDDAGEIEEADLAKIQVTSFSCGGIVVSPNFSHVFCDGIISALFLKIWAATTAALVNNYSTDRVPVLLAHPRYGASSLFPQQEAYPDELTWKEQSKCFAKPQKFAVRRFLFSAKAISELRDKANCSSIENSSRVEAVTAFISKRIMAASKSESESESSPSGTLLTQSVNLRGKAKPQLPDHLVGNIVWNANALCTSLNDDLVFKLREAVSRIDGDFVKSLQGAGGFRNFSKLIKDEAQMYCNVSDRIAFGSWSHLGLYDVDFGWGKPIWVSLACISDLKSTLVILMNTRHGDGIEAWVYLLVEHMALLEDDEELLAFSTMDPCPLTLSISRL